MILARLAEFQHAVPRQVHMVLRLCMDLSLVSIWLSRPRPLPRMVAPPGTGSLSTTQVASATSCGGSTVPDTTEALPHKQETIDVLLKFVDENLQPNDSDGPLCLDASVLKVFGKY